MYPKNLIMVFSFYKARESNDLSKIHTCNSRSCISIWHMSIRESKLACESAGFLMELIDQTIKNRTMGEDLNALQTLH